MAPSPRFDHAAWTGACECGSVAFEVRGPMRAAVACGCTQCRRTCTTTAVFTSAMIADLVMTNVTGLTWYRSSDTARRGFCKTCGASVFFKTDANENTNGRVSVAAGLLNTPVGLPLAATIYAGSAQPHDPISDHAPCFEIDHDDSFSVPWFDAPETLRTEPV